MTQITQSPALRALAPVFTCNDDLAWRNRALEDGTETLFHQTLWNLGSNPA